MPAHRITAILISRFLLDLQTAERHAVCMSSSSPAFNGDSLHEESLVFERVMGSLTSVIGSTTEDDALDSEEYLEPLDVRRESLDEGDHDAVSA